MTLKGLIKNPELETISTIQMLSEDRSQRGEREMIIIRYPTEYVALDATVKVLRRIFPQERDSFVPSKKYQLKDHPRFVIYSSPTTNFYGTNDGTFKENYGPGCYCFYPKDEDAILRCLKLNANGASRTSNYLTVFEILNPDQVFGDESNIGVFKDLSHFGEGAKGMPKAASTDGSLYVLHPHLPSLSECCARLMENCDIKTNRKLKSIKDNLEKNERETKELTAEIKAIEKVLRNNEFEIYWDERLTKDEMLVDIMRKLLLTKLGKRDEFKMTFDLLHGLMEDYCTNRVRQLTQKQELNAELDVLEGEFKGDESKALFLEWLYRTKVVLSVGVENNIRDCEAKLKEILIIDYRYNAETENYIYSNNTGIKSKFNIGEISVKED